jgi:hypothetical protein
MTITKERPTAHQFTMREVVRYVATREMEPLDKRSVAELRDVGSPGGPVVPRGQIRLVR